MTFETQKKFNDFSEFYPYYLSEHENLTCRRLHFVGSTLILILLAYTAITAQWAWLWFVPILGYGFAWAGHYFFEHNRPATFKYPFYSLLGDWVMFKDILLGNIKR
jgi:hypothetical protein